MPNQKESLSTNGLEDRLVRALRILRGSVGAVAGLIVSTMGWGVTNDEQLVQEIVTDNPDSIMASLLRHNSTATGLTMVLGGAALFSYSWVFVLRKREASVEEVTELSYSELRPKLEVGLEICHEANVSPAQVFDSRSGEIGREYIEATRRADEGGNGTSSLDYLAVKIAEADIRS